MKALFAPKSAKQIGLVVAIFLAATPLIYPEVLLPQIVLASNAQTGGNQPLVFEIKDSSLIQKSLNLNSLSFDNLVQSDPLAVKLKDYLESYNSPLAEYAGQIIQQPQWQRALAVSWVESNYGSHCYDNNCSGIGVKPGHPSWRKYPTKLSWFIDLTQLLEKPIYKEKYTTFEKMRGVYVNPGSNAWVYGAKTKYAELMALTKDAEEERSLAMQNNQFVASSNTVSPLLAQLTK